MFASSLIGDNDGCLSVGKRQDSDVIFPEASYLVCRHAKITTHRARKTNSYDTDIDACKRTRVRESEFSKVQQSASIKQTSKYSTSCSVLGVYNFGQDAQLYIYYSLAINIFFSVIFNRSICNIFMILLSFNLNAMVYHTNTHTLYQIVCKICLVYLVMYYKTESRSVSSFHWVTCPSCDDSHHLSEK